MRLGIIGRSGAGKQAIFEALTGIAIGPGAKNEDHVGTIRVPDKRVDHLSGLYNPRKTTYAQIEYFLPGFALREETGRKETEPPEEWNRIRNCDALIHVVRNFTLYGMDDPNPESDFITMGTFGVLLNSMNDLMHDTAPGMVLSIKPQNTLTFDIGAGTMDASGNIIEPLLIVRSTDFSIDFYGLIDYRYIRMFRIVGDLAVPLSAVRRGDVFVLPSRATRTTELPLAAMAAGLAIVAPADSVLDFLIHDQTALLYPQHDEDALTEHLQRLVDDPEAARRLAAPLRRRDHDPGRRADWHGGSRGRGGPRRARG